MVRSKRTAGFSLIEILLVLAIMGIISAIAIPAYVGQRRRARVIGDAQSNAQVLRMMLESSKADAGIYGAVGTYVWKASGTVPSASTNIAPAFAPKGVSQMNYSVQVKNSGLTYVLSVNDPRMSSALTFQTDQNGTQLFVLR